MQLMAPIATLYAHIDTSTCEKEFEFIDRDKYFKHHEKLQPRKVFRFEGGEIKGDELLG